MTRYLKLALALAILVVLPTHAEEEKPKEPTWKAYWKNGTRVESSDGKFKLKFGGRLQADFTFITKQDDVFEDGFQDGSEFRRARLFFEGTVYDNVSFKVQYDFAGGDADFKDVWLSFDDTVVGDVKIGHFKEPFSLEVLTSSKYVTFVERSLPVIFAPERNMGIGIGKSSDRITWGAGIFRESDDFGTSIGEDRRNLTGRFVFRPIVNEDVDRVLHIGLNYTNKESAGLNNDFRLRSRPEFHFGPRPIDTGNVPFGGMEVFDLEVAGVFGPFWFAGEYIEADVDTAFPALPMPVSVTLPGYYAQAGFFLTGETRTYKTDGAVWDRVKPSNNMGSGEGSGAWEIALRISETDLSEGPLTGGELSSISAALNWYPNPATRMMFNYIMSDVKDVGKVDAAVVRAQIDF